MHLPVFTSILLPLLLSLVFLPIVVAAPHSAMLKRRTWHSARIAINSLFFSSRSLGAKAFLGIAEQ